MAKHINPIILILECQFQSENQSDINRLEIEFKRCPDIKHISIHIRTQTNLFNEPVIILITDYCPPFESIHLSLWNVSDEVITWFAHRLGHKLKSIEFNYSDESTLKKEQELLKLCPNLKIMESDNNSFIDAIKRWNSMTIWITHHNWPKWIFGFV